MFSDLPDSDVDVLGPGSSLHQAFEKRDELAAWCGGVLPPPHGLGQSLRPAPRITTELHAGNIQTRDARPGRRYRQLRIEPINP